MSYLSVSGKVSSLRKKYVQDFDKNNLLSHIVHYSFPVVYPNYLSDMVNVNYDRARMHQRRRLLRKHLNSMLDMAFFSGARPYLISLTFTDDLLASTNFETRKKYVRDYLNSVCEDYTACVDYGKVNGREHYHAIATSFVAGSFFTIRRKVFFEPLSAWPYGFYSFRPIDSDNSYKVSNYAFKASNYAFKSSNSSVKPFHKRCVFYATKGEINSEAWL